MNLDGLSGDEMISEKDLREAIRILEEIESKPPEISHVFFTGGTGIPDEMAIEYWKDSNVIVVTRDGTQYQYGKILKENK